MSGQVDGSATGNPLLRGLSVARSIEGEYVENSHFNGGHVPGTLSATVQSPRVPNWRDRPVDRTTQHMSAFRSAKLAAFLLNACRNVPGLASNAMPIELATWLIMKTGKVTQQEIDASETDPGRDGRHCAMCFDQPGKRLYKVSTTVPGHKLPPDIA